MNYVDFHQFNFLVRENSDTLDIRNITEKYFNISFSEFTLVPRYRNFYKRYYTFHNMINIYCDGVGDASGTTFFEIKGNGCDTLDINFFELTKFCIENNHKINSIHLYLDDTNNILPMDRIFTEFKTDSRNRIISQSKQAPLLMDRDCKSLYFGSKKSNSQVTIYEKGKMEGTDFNWNRIEIKLSDNETIHRQLTDYINGVELGVIASGLLKRLLDFKVDGYQPKARRETEPFWIEFLGDVEKRTFGKLAKPKPNKEKEMENLKKHITKKINEYGDDVRLLLESLLFCHEPDSVSGS